jgi:hypothetical protein
MSGIRLLLYEWTSVERRCRIAGFSGRTIAPWRAAHLLLLESRSVLASRAPHVGVLDLQTYQGGTRGSRLCGGDRDRETENSKVCARTRDTRFIQVQVAKVANPTSCLGDQVWHPALGVG